MRLGYSQREAVLLLYLLGGVFGMIGLFVTQATIVEGYIIGGIVGGMGLYAIYWLDDNVNPFRPKNSKIIETGFFQRGLCCAMSKTRFLRLKNLMENKHE